MSQPKHLIVGYDFSLGARAALAAAVRLGTDTGASLQLVTALPGAMDAEQMRALWEVRGADQSPEAALAGTIDAVRGMVADDVAKQQLGGLEPELTVTTRGPAEGLAETITDYDETLVVVGTLGRQLYADKRHIGLDAQRLCRISRSPVLVVDRDCRFPPRRLLCGVDYSLASENALAWAVSLASRYGAQLTVVHILEQKHFMTFADRPGPDELLPGELDAAERRLDEFLASHLPAGLAVKTRLAPGEAAQGMLAIAEEEKIDLLCFGSVGTHAEKAIRIGGHAERLLGRACCSLLVVKPLGFARSAQGEIDAGT